jgi:YtkA-like
MTQEISPRPIRVGACDVTLSLKDDGARPMTGADVTLEADMSHPGMAPVFGDARELSAGRYRGGVELTMPGDWVVLVHIKLANGQKAEREIELKGVQAK